MSEEIKSNDSLDRWFPSQGQCAFCATQDARHRLIDAIVERFKAGESIKALAEDYSLPEEAIIAATSAGK